jgi:hypothetical protein
LNEWLAETNLTAPGDNGATIRLLKPADRLITLRSLMLFNPRNRDPQVAADVL